MPTPKNVMMLQAFLSLANNYQIYIPNIHNVKAPLIDLFEKEYKMVSIYKCQKAFKELKSILTSDLSSTHFCPKLETILATDSSAYGVGAILLHKYDDGREKALTSRLLLSTEKNYKK